MPISKVRNSLRPAALVAIMAVGSAGCGGEMFQQQNVAPPSVATVPAVRLNFRFEPDVPPPTVDISKQSADDRNPAVQADFDNNRQQEIVDKMIPSPDRKRIAVVYHKVTDYSSEYRIDMYSPDGKLLRKATSDAMAVHLPDTIVWSPDSSTLAFVAMIRLIAPAAEASPLPAVTPDPENPDAVPSPVVPAVPTPEAPTGILTFRSEQIYTCDADGAGTKALTQNEGLIYFYYGWSPDSSMLAALAATVREWKYLDYTSASKGEALVPQGRLRIIEKNGRERRLDDNLTAVRPVWSPDSTKVAAAFETQVRIYDAAAINPTQAAIPLRNQLLISSQAYDRNQQRLSQGGDANADPNAAAQPDQPLSTLPDEKLLVSYNPIVEIAWTAQDMVYFQTAYLKRMRNETENVRSFARWHRLIFSAQPAVATNKQ